MAKTFFINPVTSVRYRGKPASTKRWKASGFSRNRPRTAKAPTKRQLAARKKFAAMARARAAAGRKKVRAHSRSTGEAGMARRKRKAVTRRSPRRRRRVSTARRRVYAANPVRRKRRRGRSVARRSSSRRRYRRNPPGGLVGSLINVGINAGGVVAGRVAYNIAQQQLGAMIASPTDTPTMAQGKKLLVGGRGRGGHHDARAEDGWGAWAEVQRVCGGGRAVGSDDCIHRGAVAHVDDVPR